MPLRLRLGEAAVRKAHTGMATLVVAQFLSRLGKTSASLALLARTGSLGPNIIALTLADQAQVVAYT